MPEYKILVVEDSPIMRQLIAFALNGLKGTRIMEASNGVDGLKKLSNDCFNLVITDINMPEMDGFKLISLVKKNDDLRNMPIIVITTADSQEDKEKAVALGVNAYVTKPTNAPQILALVQGIQRAGRPREKVQLSPFLHRLAFDSR